MTDDLIITNGNILPLVDYQPDQARPALIRPGYVRIKNRMILAVGSMAELPAGTAAEQTIDADGGLVMPGLVNTHCHAAMTLFRGLADDLPLMTWLNEHIFPAEAAHVNPDMVYWCTRLAIAEMIRSGTTTVADGYFHEEAAARAFMDCGFRAVAAQGVIDFPAPGAPDPAKNIDNAAGFLDNWWQKSELVTPAVFCHSPYTCSPETLARAKKLAREKGRKFFIHLAETSAEIEKIKKLYNTTPVRLLDSLGLLDRDTVCVHCVWLDEEELDILVRSKAAVAICTKSNMKLASGIAPLKEMLRRGIPVGLGTDSCASNNSLDLFSEMTAGAMLHKVNDMDPTAMPAGQMIHLAARGGAEVLGLDEIIGSLTPGKAADIIIIDLNQPHLTPFYNPDLLVYTARGPDVSTVIINGRIVMQDRRLLSFDLDKTMLKVREMSSRLSGQPG